MASQGSAARGSGGDDSTQDLPTGSLARSMRLAGLPLGIAGRRALGLGKRLAGQSADEVAQATQAANAEHLFQVLGQLKGGAMKFGQALSTFEAAFPEEVSEAWRSGLTRLQESAPAMTPETMKRVLARELGADWSARFRSFDDTPSAAASIGQVHHAVWEDGREAAVKIQYPGVEKALTADMDQIVRMSTLTKRSRPAMADPGPILAEVQQRFTAELDYVREGQAQAAAHLALRGSHAFRVPDVLLATPRVLVTEWLDGVPLARVIADGTRQQRDRAAGRLLEFIVGAPSVAGLLQGDPHPGNFRLLDDGRLGILDFGAVIAAPDGLPVEFGHLIRAALAEDPAETVRLLSSLGFTRPGSVVDPQRTLATVAPFLAPLRAPVFRIDRAWMRGLFAAMEDFRGFARSATLTVPARYFVLQRAWWSGLGVLAQLDGDVPALDIFEEWLPGFRP